MPGDHIWLTIEFIAPKDGMSCGVHDVHERELRISNLGSECPDVKLSDNDGFQPPYDQATGQ